jgi:hypothetical protein
MCCIYSWASSPKRLIRSHGKRTLKDSCLTLTKYFEQLLKNFYHTLPITFVPSIAVIIVPSFLLMETTMNCNSIDCLILSAVSRFLKHESFRIGWTIKTTQLLALGLIQPTSSPWAHLSYSVKSNGKNAICIDYHVLAKWRCTTSTTFRAATNADVPKTAFSARYGHYKFSVLLFRLINASTSKSNERHIREYLDKLVIVYLDDILLFSITEDDHNTICPNGASKIQKAKLIVNRWI